MKRCYPTLIASVICLAGAVPVRAQSQAVTIAELRHEIAAKNATIAELRRQLATKPGFDLVDMVSSYNVALRQAQEDNDTAKADADELTRWGWRGYNTVIINPETGEQADPVQTRHLREMDQSRTYCQSEKVNSIRKAFDLLAKLHANPDFDKFYVETNHFVPLTNMEDWTDYVGVGGKTAYDLRWIELRDLNLKPGHS